MFTDERMQSAITTTNGREYCDYKSNWSEVMQKKVCIEIIHSVSESCTTKQLICFPV